MPKTQPCYPEEVLTCGNTWSSSSQVCPLYSLPVKAKDGRLYHNPHCAACNGQEMNQTQCTSLRSSNLFRANLNFVLFPSISYILKFQQNQTEECESDQFYDKLYGKCYSLKCGKKFENHAGVCVR